MKIRRGVGGLRSVVKGDRINSKRRAGLIARGDQSNNPVKNMGRQINLGY
jgi:hypothetical protein